METKPQTTNQVQFSEHAIDRVLNRYNKVTSYAQVQTVLVNKPLRNGVQTVVIATLDKLVTVIDPTARDGKVTGNKVCAVTEVTENTQVEVITITLK